MGRILIWISCGAILLAKLQIFSVFCFLYLPFLNEF